MPPNGTSRDTGLRQVKTATKWIAGAAAVLAGSIAFWGAQTAGSADAGTRNVTRQPAGSSNANSGRSDDAYSDPGDSSGSLQAPDAAPAPTDQLPSARSGGS